MKSGISLIYIFFIFPHLVFASEMSEIASAAKINDCISVDKVEKKYAFLKRLSSWYVKSESNNSSAIMFWCHMLNSPNLRSGSYIVVISAKAGHPWAQCATVIKNLRGSPTNLSIDGLNVSGEFDSGGYYFKCREGKWQIKYSH